MYAIFFIEILVLIAILAPLMFRSILREDELEQERRVNPDTTYTCPMHPEIVKKKLGNCPVCKTMALVDSRELSIKELTGYAKIMQTYKPLIVVLFTLFVVSFNIMLFYQASFGNGTSNLNNATGASSLMAGMAMSGVSSSQIAPASLLSYNSLMVFMMVFMAGFFLVFGGLQLLNIKAFSARFATYDVIAKRWKLYGYLYPFIEIALGICFIFSIAPRVVSVATAVFLMVGAYGILQKVHSKQQLSCACLGTRFDIPLTYVTFVENMGMAAMALIMLV